MKNRIRELRKEKGLSQRELAKKVGVSFQSISFYENEDRVPKLETWIKLANFFNVPVSYIQGISDIKDAKAFKNFESFSNKFDNQNGISSKEFKAFSHERNLMKLYTLFNELIASDDSGYNLDDIKGFKNILNSLSDYQIQEIVLNLSMFFEILLYGTNGNQSTLNTLHDIFDILVRDGFVPFDPFETNSTNK